jgi:hypothetical protein
MKYYVYQLIDPRTGTPFYVGKGCGKRAYNHLKYKSKDDCPWNNRLGTFIGDLAEVGIVPLIEIVSEGHTEDDALDIEEDYIRKYGRKHIDADGILLNYYGHRGNSTIARPPVSVETRKKISDANKGKQRSDAHKAILSTTQKDAVRHLKETGDWERVTELNRIAHLGKKQSEDTIAKRSISIKMTKEEKYGGKYNFSDDARRNIRQSQLGNEKHAHTWDVTSADGSVERIKNLAKWMRDNGLVKMRDGVRVKHHASGQVVFTIAKVGAAV